MLVPEPAPDGQGTGIVNEHWQEPESWKLLDAGLTKGIEEARYK
jgi:hypothetical protein